MPAEELPANFSFLNSFLDSLFEEGESFFLTTYHSMGRKEGSVFILVITDWQSDDRWDGLEMAENALAREEALEQIEHDANHEASLAVAQAA